MRGDERDRLANPRTVLNQTAQGLHAPQALLGERSLREVHELLAAAHTAPSLPGAPEPAAASGQAVLDDYHELAEVFRRLSDRWHVSPLDFACRDTLQRG